MPRKETNTGPISAQAQQDQVSDGIENFELPKSLVSKIAKSALPENAKLQKETVLSLVKGSTVFINYLAATAHDVALSKQHRSISASDVLRALEMIEFGDLVDKLQQELLAYRELAKTDKTRKGSTSINPNGNSAGSVSTGQQVPPKSYASISTGPTTISAPVPSGSKHGPVEPEAHSSPFTSTPLHAYDGESVGDAASMGSRMPVDVDWEDELGERDQDLDGAHQDDENEYDEPIEEDENVDDNDKREDTGYDSEMEYPSDADPPASKGDKDGSEIEREYHSD